VTSQFKACPRYKTPAPVAAPRRSQCGHVYRKQFAPVDDTPMLDVDGLESAPLGHGRGNVLTGSGDVGNQGATDHYAPSSAILLSQKSSTFVNRFLVLSDTSAACGLR
jgi:hypothetical protein